MPRLILRHTALAALRVGDAFDDFDPAGFMVVLACPCPACPSPTVCQSTHSSAAIRPLSRVFQRWEVSITEST